MLSDINMDRTYQNNKNFSSSQVVGTPPRLQDRLRPVINTTCIG